MESMGALTGRERESVVARLSAAYREDTARMLRARIPYAVLVFALAMGTGSVFEVAYYEGRTHGVLVVDAAYVVVCLAALAASRARGGRLPQAWIAAGLASVLTLLMCAYHASVGAVAERLAMAELCLLTVFLFLLPLGTRPQMLVAGAALAGFTLAAPSLRPSETLAFNWVVLTTGAGTSVLGAAFLDRYRGDAFVRAGLLAETSAVNSAILEAALDASSRSTTPAASSSSIRPRSGCSAGAAPPSWGATLADALVPPRLRTGTSRASRATSRPGEGGLLGRRRELRAMRADGQRVPGRARDHAHPARRRRRPSPAICATSRRGRRPRRASRRRSAESEEQAEIAAALVRVGETLNGHLNQPDLLERVTRLAAEALRTDTALTFLWDDRRAAFRLARQRGRPDPRSRPSLEQVDFTVESLPAVRALGPGSSSRSPTRDAPGVRPAPPRGALEPGVDALRARDASRRDHRRHGLRATGRRRARSRRSSAAWRWASRTRPRSRSRTRG